MPTGMDGDAIALAALTQDATTALYQLQTALINYHSYSKGSEDLAEGIQHIRNGLRAAWDNFIVFFQRCQGYCDDYISLCSYSITLKPQETLVFARDVLAVASTLAKEVKMLRDKQVETLSDANMQAKNLPSTFRRSRTPGNPRMCDILINV